MPAMSRSRGWRLAPLLALLVAGCVNLDEEIWLSADGSGRAHIVYAHSLQLLRTAIPHGLGPKPIPLDPQELLGDLKDASGVTIDSATQRLDEKGQRIIDARIRFRKIENLSDDRVRFEFSSRPDGHDFRITVLNTDKSTLPVDEPGGIISRRAIFLNMLSAYRLRFVVHLPGTIRSSNAAQRYGRTLSWEVPLKDLVSQDQVVLEAQVAPSLWERIRGLFVKSPSS